MLSVLTCILFSALGHGDTVDEQLQKLLDAAALGEDNPTQLDSLSKSDLKFLKAQIEDLDLAGELVECADEYCANDFLTDFHPDYDG